MRVAVVFMLGVLGLTLLSIDAGTAASAPNHPIAARPLGAFSVITIGRLAGRGSALYQTYLGYMYETGQGVPQDYHLAAYWYRLAAEQGHVRAQHLLGLLYDRGQGVPLNYVEAHKWLNLAAAGSARDDRDYYVRIRNAVASKLTRAEIYDAQRRARDWKLGREDRNNSSR
jgi:hypothetical protein